MTINQAIRILDPDTSSETLGEIEYYGGLHGREKMVAGRDEACRVAVGSCRSIRRRTRTVTEYSDKVRRYLVWRYGITDREGKH